MNRKSPVTVGMDQVRTIAVALAGFAALLAMVPAWATQPLLGFGALYAVLVLLVDHDVRALFTKARPLDVKTSQTAI